MLSEQETRNLITMMKGRIEFIVDPDEKKRHIDFINGLECVLNE